MFTNITPITDLFSAVIAVPTWGSMQAPGSTHYNAGGGAVAAVSSVANVNGVLLRTVWLHQAGSDVLTVSAGSIAIFDLSNSGSPQRLNLTPNIFLPPGTSLATNSGASTYARLGYDIL